MILAKNLTKYYGSLCAVENISFTVPRGEILGLLGPNGAGKTTTMRMERRGANDPMRAKYEAIARRRLVRKLRRLERDVERSSTFGDAATRRHPTSRMRAVANSGSESRFADFAPPPGIPAP